jgi:hypothetical protein
MKIAFVLLLAVTLVASIDHEEAYCQFDQSAMTAAKDKDLNLKVNVAFGNSRQEEVQ